MINQIDTQLIELLYEYIQQPINKVQVIPKQISIMDKLFSFSTIPSTMNFEIKKKRFFKCHITVILFIFYFDSGKINLYFSLCYFITVLIVLIVITVLIILIILIVVNVNISFICYSTHKTYSKLESIPYSHYYIRLFIYQQYIKSTSTKNVGMRGYEQVVFLKRYCFDKISTQRSDTDNNIFVSLKFCEKNCDHNRGTGLTSKLFYGKIDGCRNMINNDETKNSSEGKKRPRPEEKKERVSPKGAESIKANVSSKKKSLSPVLMKKKGRVVLVVGGKRKTKEK